MRPNLPTDAAEAGISVGKLDASGELELILEVDGKVGSCFISRDFWQAVGAMFDRSTGTPNKPGGIE